MHWVAFRRAHLTFCILHSYGQCRFQGMLTKYNYPINEASHFTTPRDVLTSEYKFTTLHHTTNIPSLRVSLCVSAHLLHLIFCPSLCLYYSLRLSYVDPYYYGCVDNIPTACSDQSDPQSKKHQRENRKSGRRTANPDDESSSDTKIQSVVLT
jgi:hypothetical protein